MMKKSCFFGLFLLFCVLEQVALCQTDSVSVVVKSNVLLEGRYRNSHRYKQLVQKGKVFVESTSVEFRSNDGCKKWWKKGHWAGVGIGYNGLISNLGHLSLPDDAKYLSLQSKSITVMVNPIDFAIVSRRNWSLVSGLGFEFNNFNFERNLTLMSYNGQIAPDLSYIRDGVVLEKTKLLTSYLNIPLLMEFRFGGYNGGFINFGVIGGWRMQSHTKIKADLPGSDKVKSKNNQHLKNFHYGATVSGGFRNIGLYMTYYPQSIFRKEEGPHVEQVNVGVAILL